MFGKPTVTKHSNKSYKFADGGAVPDDYGPTKKSKYASPGFDIRENQKFNAVSGGPSGSVEAWRKDMPGDRMGKLEGDISDAIAKKKGK